MGPLVPHEVTYAVDLKVGSGDKVLGLKFGLMIESSVATDF